MPAQSESISSQIKSLEEDFVKPSNLVEERGDLLTHPQLIWLIRCRDKNGLANADAVKKVGRKIYLSRSRFWKWFDTQSA